MNFINKVNKHLLENYPLIWNTRLVWMLVANVFVHLLFFMIGYSSANTITDLKEHYTLSNFFFETSTVYYNFLISIFILLIWIIYYLRNNAFKNLYSFKRGMLFKQFCIILFIFFISTTQYFSFKKGLVTKIKSLYSWVEVNEDIKAFNSISLFLMHNQADYKIDKKKYPKPFPLKVAINNKNSTDNIDFKKPYLEYEGTQFQFYNINEKLWQEDSKQNEYLTVYGKHSFKYRNIEDISAFKELLHPSLYNYSGTKFTIGQDSIDLENQLKYFQNILNNQDESKIKDDLKKGLYLARKYELSTNLSIESWFDLVNNSPNYLLKELINVSNPVNKELRSYTSNSNKGIDNVADLPYSKTLYFSFNNLDHFFSNVYSSYYPTFNDVIFNFLVAIAFFLSVVLFVFKTTNTKSLLLSFVASLVILVIIIWLMSSGDFLLSGDEVRSYREFLIMIFISLIILILSIILYLNNTKKLLISITFTLGLFALPILFVFSSLAYSKYLDKSHKYLYPKAYNYVSDFEKWFNNYGVFAAILVWFLAVFIYATLIRKLNARAE